MRLAAFILAVIAVLFLGHLLYELLWFTIVAWPSLLLGLAAAAGAYMLRRRARRPVHGDG